MLRRRPRAPRAGIGRQNYLFGAALLYAGGGGRDALITPREVYQDAVSADARAARPSGRLSVLDCLKLERGDGYTLCFCACCAVWMVLVCFQCGVHGKALE